MYQAPEPGHDNRKTFALTPEFACLALTLPSKPDVAKKHPPNAFSEARRCLPDGAALVQEDPAHSQSAYSRVEKPLYGFNRDDLVSSHVGDLDGEYRRWLLKSAHETVT